ncbi:MAG: potassium channel protein [Deltaproteobacteria bacterium]|nr:potassium channel protein [Deltaproteobacteria bacterium]
MQKRLRILLLLLLAVFALGIFGFFILGHLAGGQPSLLDCAYQTVITLTTLGSREMLPLANFWYGEFFVIVLMLTGMGVLFVFATSLTAFLVEGEIRNIFRRKKMEKILKNIKDHIIVCGAGATGGYVIAELLGSSQTLVIVDADENRIQHICKAHTKSMIPYVVGQAADDDVLIEAGIDRARGIVATLPDERDNLFITVTARQSNPKVKIVVRASDSQAETRLARAGADSVVSPSRIGGMRLASEMVRPQVVSFLDEMLHDQDKTLRIEEIPLTRGCKMIGSALMDTNLRQEADLLVLAIRDPSGQHYLYNPSPEHILEENATLIVLGPVESVHKIRSRMTYEAGNGQ